MDKYFRFAALLLPVTVVCLVSQSFEVPQEDADQEASANEATTISPTEPNWFTQMQLVYGPAFGELKKQIGSEADGDEVDYVAVRRNALIISEFTARLAAWPEINNFKSEEAKAAYVESHGKLEIGTVQKHAAAIYNAATNKELGAAKESFVAMTNSCNVCHREKQSRWAPVTLEH